MKKYLFSLLLFLPIAVHAQHDFLGKSQETITEHFESNRIYKLLIDTLSEKNILLTFKSKFQYPYYTYKIDLEKGYCTSFGLVSKDTEMKNTLIDMLEFVGEVIVRSDLTDVITYRLKKNGKIRYYQIAQPYAKSKNKRQRKLFYVLVSQMNF